MPLSAVRQAELHSDLKIQEKDELQWKKLKAEGLDQNGEKEAQLRRSFNGDARSLFLAVLCLCVSLAKLQKTKSSVFAHKWNSVRFELICEALISLKAHNKQWQHPD